MPYIETAILAVIIVLTGYYAHRSLSFQIHRGLNELDGKLALAIKELVENLPLDMDGPNPMQMMLFDLIKSKMQIEPALMPPKDESGKFISDNQ